jgi:hypothetical protein
MEEIADLAYIVKYAKTIMEELKLGKSPTMGFLNRMSELANKVQRKYKEQHEQARRGTCP